MLRFKKEHSICFDSPKSTVYFLTQTLFTEHAAARAMHKHSVNLPPNITHVSCVVHMYSISLHLMSFTYLSPSCPLFMLPLASRPLFASLFVRFGFRRRICHHTSHMCHILCCLLSTIDCIGLIVSLFVRVFARFLG